VIKNMTKSKIVKKLKKLIRRKNKWNRKSYFVRKKWCLSLSSNHINTTSYSKLKILKGISSSKKLFHLLLIINFS